jgi:hypothetical protein
MTTQINSQTKNLYDSFRIEIIEYMFMEVKEFIFFNNGMVGAYSINRQLDLEHYLDERKGKEVLNSV